MRNITLFILLLVSSLSFSCQRDDTASLNIATAANMQFAMQAITTAFTMETGIKCNMIVSSSGKLTAQIREGAPFDVLVSANMKYPQALHEDSLSWTEPKVYAYGKLVLWSMAASIMPDIESLGSDSLKFVAVANPQNAPYGQAAMKVLENLGHLPDIESKLVYGESIAQTNQFITSGAAELGFTAKSVVLSNQMGGQGSWLEVDASLYDPIAQGVVLLKNSEQVDQARQFYNFLFSERAQSILVNFGYAIN